MIFLKDVSFSTKFSSKYYLTGYCNRVSVNSPIRNFSTRQSHFLKFQFYCFFCCKIYSQNRIIFKWLHVWHQEIYMYTRRKVLNFWGNSWIGLQRGRVGIYNDSYLEWFRVKPHYWVCDYMNSYCILRVKFFFQKFPLLANY